MLPAEVSYTGGTAVGRAAAVDLRGVNCTMASIRERVAIDAVRAAPKALYSGAIGWGARRRLPMRWREPAYRAFARCVGASLDEVELPLAAYASFGDFFARRLRPGARPIEAGPGDWIAPCDGALAAAGVLDGDPIAAKGRGFSLPALLADDALAGALAGGRFSTYYLSPRDYHRVHAPVDLEIVSVRYVPGALYPVHPFFADRIDEIFAVNERLVVSARTARGPMALVLVGAAGVGNVTLSQPSVEVRHLRGAGPWGVDLMRPLALERGAEVGAFQLGSTVIVCMAAEVAAALEHLDERRAVRFGDVVARHTGGKS